MKEKIIILFNLALTSLISASPEFSGYVTASYNKNLNNPDSRTNSPLNYYFQGREATFQLDAAHLSLTGGDSGKATYGVDFDAGTNSRWNAGADTSSVGNGWGYEIQQAYLAFPLNGILGIKGGKFYTTEGIEGLNSGNNPTISRGLIFSLSEPLAHTGVVLTATPAERVDFAVGAVNGWDNWLSPADDGIPTALVKVGLNFGNPFAGTVTAYYGPYANRDNLLSLDFTAVNKSVSIVDINFQVNYLLKEAASSAADGKDLSNLAFGLQPVFHLPYNTQVGARYEFLHQKDGSSSINFHTVAVAPGWRPTPSTIVRAEFRADIADEKVFEDDKGVYSKKVEPLVSAELNYTF